MPNSSESINLYHYVCCDICGSEKYTNLYRLTNTFIVECSECQFHYINPRLSSEKLQERVQQWSVEDTVDEERLRIAFDYNTLKLYQKFINQLNKYIKCSERTLLDIGCSVGAFLSIAKKNNYSVTGLELGKASAQYTEQNFNIPVINRSIFDYSENAPGYDVISMLEVIEHLESPRLAMKQIHHWLKKDGLVFITTPNFDSLYRRLHGKKWWVINCEDEHIMFFNYKSIKKLLHDTGFEIVHFENRGIDISGIISLFKKQPDISGAPVNTNDEDYYDARDRKESIKRILKRFYLDDLIRFFLNVFYKACSVRYSPFFGMGEQLIVIARKKDL